MRHGGSTVLRHNGTSGEKLLSEDKMGQGDWMEGIWKCLEGREFQGIEGIAPFIRR